jgi:hypothetical protein
MYVDRGQYVDNNKDKNEGRIWIIIEDSTSWYASEKGAILQYILYVGGDSAVIWTSQVTLKFYIQVNSRATSSMKKVSIIGN